MAKRPDRGFEVPKSEETAEFYRALTQGDVKRGLWGADSRFDADKIADHGSVQKYFGEFLEGRLKKRERVLDIGCGPGGFLAVLAGVAGEVVGVDLSPDFVGVCRETIARRGLENARVEEGNAESLEFEDTSFDAVVLVDVIHHLESIEPVLREARRVLRPGGKLLVFEPNKLNPLLYAMCVLDRNEWGLLRLGSKRKYRGLLSPLFELEEVSYSGLLIGPDGPIAMGIADLLSDGATGKLLGWLSPKLFIEARRPA